MRLARAALSLMGGPSYFVPGREGGTPTGGAIFGKGWRGGHWASGPPRSALAAPRAHFLRCAPGWERPPALAPGPRLPARAAVPTRGTPTASSQPARLVGSGSAMAGRGSCTHRVAHPPRGPPPIWDSVGLGFLGCERRAQPRRTGRGTPRRCGHLRKCQFLFPFPDRREPSSGRQPQVPLTTTEPEPHTGEGWPSASVLPVCHSATRTMNLHTGCENAAFILKRGPCGPTGEAAGLSGAVPPLEEEEVGDVPEESGRRPLEETARLRASWREPDRPTDTGLQSFPAWGRAAHRVGERNRTAPGVLAGRLRPGPALPASTLGASEEAETSPPSLPAASLWGACLPFGQ